MIARGYLKDVTPKEVEWLWKPYIAFGKVTLIQGDIGIGKTSLMIKVIADLSRGLYPPTMFRDQLQPQKRGEAIISYYVSIENDIADTIVPLFDLFGGDRNFVQYQIEERGHFVLSGDEIRECVRQSGARLIVIDPWQHFLDNDSTANNEDLRNRIREVQNAAEETGAAVVLCGNYTKAVVRSGISRGVGGLEMVNALSSVLTVKRGSNPVERQMVVSKMSFIGKECSPVLIRQLDDYNLEYMTSEGGVRSTGDRAIEFLNNLLADGPVDSNEVKQKAKEAGFAPATLQRAKTKAGITSRRLGDRSCLWERHTLSP